jgi:hypothetical protein
VQDPANQRGFSVIDMTDENHAQRRSR